MNTDLNTPYNIPLFISKVNAGFPSPASDYTSKRLDLCQYLIKNPESTFFIRAIGDSMINAGIDEGDLLVVDKSLEPKNNSIVIAVIHNEFTVKRLIKNKDELYLRAENTQYPHIPISEESELNIWGIVTSIVKKCI